MGQRDYFDKKPTLGEKNNALVFLFTVNTIVFLILIFLKLVFLLEYRAEADAQFIDKVLYWFTLSPEASQLLYKPWSIIIYAFTNLSLMGFLSNMLWLWSFGYILQDLIGNKKLIPIYLYGAFIGGLFFILVSFILKTDVNYLNEGSNTAILAVAIATTTLSPNYKIFQHIGSGFSLWILTVVFVVIDVSFISFTNWAVVASHVVAAFVGFIFIQQIKKGNDWSNWMYALSNYLGNMFSPKSSQENKAQTTNIKLNSDQEKVDTILDKINMNGYDSLSKSEKEFLENLKK